MSRLSFFSLVAAAAICGGSAFFVAPAKADCSGFICEAVKGVPIVGAAAQAADGGIRAIKDRGSDASVLHHITTMNDWDNPPGRPAQGPAPAGPTAGYGGYPPPPAYNNGYPPPPEYNNGYPPPPQTQIAYGNRCGFYGGGFKYGQTAPVGAPCLTMTPNGPLYEQVF